MTKESIIKLVEDCPDSYKGSKIILYLLEIALKSEDNYFALEVFEMIHKHLYHKTLDIIHYSRIINERAKYLELYLNGKLYIEEKPENREIQKEHAKCIEKLSESIAENNNADKDLEIARSFYL